MMEFLVLGEIRRRVNRTATLDLWRSDFGLFSRLVGRVPWEAHLKGKGVQEGRTSFKREILKTRSRRPCVLKDQPMGKRSRLPEQRALAGNQKIKGSLCTLEEGAGNEEDYKDIMRLCTEKIRRAKAQL